MDGVVICSRVCMDGLISEMIKAVSSENIDSMYTEEQINGNRKKYYIKLNTRCFLCTDLIIDALSEWIIRNFKKKIMFEILKLNFSEMTDGDIMTIINVTEKQFTELIHDNHINLVRSELSEYLLSNRILDIDGFVRFRLREYREKLEEILFNEIDGYLAEKEYDAFIDMLCEYTGSRCSLVDLIHIKEKDDGSFALFDFSHNNISVLCENELRSEIDDSCLSHEDKLVSILLILIPNRIIWHRNAKNMHKNLIKTIGRIFDGRLSVCMGCNLCDN